MSLNFRYGRNDLESQDIVTLDSVLTILKKNTNVSVMFSTHTDNIGSDQFNQVLSENRAAYLATYLIKNGIKKDRITARGAGEKEPIAPNQNEDGTDNPEGRRKNRRTDLSFIIKN